MEEKTDIRCEICNPNSLSNTNFEEHVISKNHIRKCLQSNFIIITDIPPFISIGDLIKYLSDYGEIKNYSIVHENNAILQFFKPKPVNDLLSKPVCINGANLNICKVFANRREDSTKNRPNIVATKMTKTVFNDKMSFDNQITTFLDQVSLTDEEIAKNYKPVCKELDKIFQATFPKAKTYTFGSTVVGLGFKNCDLDLYLNIGLPVVYERDAATGPHVITAEALFSFVEKTLRSNQNRFKKLVPIPSAKVPIIKFIYQPTNVQCDLSFQNRLAIYNSDLVKYYLSLDPRIRPFAMIVKYWISKRSDILFNNYSMTMLIIFYFQQLKIVPPVIELKRKCVMPLTVNNWQVNFSKETKFCIPKNEKNSSIPSLLQRFFIFYANYDFKANVLCPLDGFSHSKDLFFELETLPSSMNSYKEYVKSSPMHKVISIEKPMCVQDPIELCQNLTHNMLDACLQKFQSYCAIAAKIVELSSKNNYQDLLANLFNLKCYKKNVTLKETTVVFDISPNNFIVEKSDTELSNDLFIKNNWFDLTLSTIKTYLEEVLNFKVEISSQDGPQAKASFDNQNLIVLSCTGTECLWLNRKVDIGTNKVLASLEKEIEVTKVMLKKLTVNDLGVVVGIDCFLEKKTEPSLFVRCGIVDKGCSEKIFSALAAHLSGKLPNLVKKTINTLRQAKNLQLA